MIRQFHDLYCLQISQVRIGPGLNIEVENIYFKKIRKTYISRNKRILLQKLFQPDVFFLKEDLCSIGIGPAVNFIFGPEQ